MNPGYADPFTGQAKLAARAFPDHRSHHLVARRHGQDGGRSASLDLIDFRVAYAAGMYLYQQFGLARLRRGYRFQHKGCRGVLQRPQAVNAHGAHCG